MKNSLFIWCCVFPYLALAQVHEDFTSDGYPHNLQWHGHPFAFGINTDNQLQSKTINTTYISAENQLATGVVWEAGIRLAFRPSLNNQLRIYLVADRDQLDGPLNGYFIQIGETGSTDGYHLYRQHGENVELLLSSPPLERIDPGLINDRIKVVRDAEGDWELLVAVDGDTFAPMGAIRDTVFEQTAFFGFHCQFTRANSDKFYFDYFSIDTTSIDIAPQLPPTESKLLPDGYDNAAFYDDFSGGLLPHWQGDSAAFEVVNKRLKVTENAVSLGFLAIGSNRLSNTVWEAGIQVEGPLSSGNYVRLYLAMTDTVLTEHDGYHVQIDGAKGKHIYHIWRQNGHSRSHVFQSDSIPNQDNRFRARVRVIHTADGRWQILTDEYDSGVFVPVPDKSGETAVMGHNTFTETAYAGFFADFSKTRRNDYAFDYLLISPANPAADIQPDTTDTDSLPPRQPYDVIINELMVNPNGVAGLPAVEYIELYNRSNDTISLTGWRYESLTKAYTFTAGDIAPDSYLILGPKKNAAEFEAFSNFTALSSWPLLVNNGTTLTLTDPYGTIIDEVNYELSWYRDSKKKNGGWSLERITPRGFCLDADNWIASTDVRGGTPGAQNAVYDPTFTINFALANCTVQNGKQLLVTYTQAIDSTTAVSSGNYRLNNGMEAPSRVQLIDRHSVLLHYDRALPTGVDYMLNVSGVANCAGLSADLEYVFFLPDTASTGDILINEILFNPKNKSMEGVDTDGVDFIEIYNYSSKTVDLQQFYLAHVNHDGKVTGHRPVSEIPLLFYPSEYKVLTAQPTIVKAHYPNADQPSFIQMASLPLFNNDAGTALMISHGQTIDSLTYHESMHAAFIDNPKGISLERRRFDTPTNSPGNFYSAATSIGGATPGYRNSQGAEEGEQPGISLTSKTFSPDNDGFEDLLEINYHFPTAGNMANISIYDDHGRLVKRLQRNQSMATRGTVTWDGRSNVYHRLPVGIYIAVIEVYNSTGLLKTYRRSFVLAKKR